MDDLKNTVVISNRRNNEIKYRKESERQELLARGDMDANSNEKNGDQTEKHNGVDKYRNSAGLQVNKFYCPAIPR